MWKITAGRGNARVNDFIDRNVVAIGWSEAGDYSKLTSKKALMELFAATWPEQRPQQIQVAAGQVWRFMSKIEIGDQVVTYDPDTRLYHLGQILTAPRYAGDIIERLPVVRDVRWDSSVSRDELSQPTRNTLGAIMTLFMLSPSAADEVSGLSTGTALAPATAMDIDVEDADPVDPYSSISEIALERVKDRILSLQWDDMQELVAALLRALGYRTIVAPRGPDRGRDIVASKDGFGFERPRIVVEVKHRRGQMGEPDVARFLSALHREDRGLYVSTGGFSKEAHYKADNAQTVVHLMSVDGLAEALLDQYENLDARGKALLPLQKIYWPA